MKRNNAGQFMKKEERIDEGIFIPVPRLSTILLIIVIGVLLLPWLRLLYSYDVLSRITSIFDFSSNLSCNTNGKMDSNDKGGQDKWDF